MSMIQIKQRLDTIINTLKARPEFENVRFVREFTTQYAETPISGFLASVRVISTGLSESYLGRKALSQIKGDMYSAGAEIIIFAPQSQNGSGLSTLAGEMLTALKEADSDGIITELSAGAIEFDANLSAIYRKLSFKMEFMLIGDDVDE